MTVAMGTRESLFTWPDKLADTAPNRLPPVALIAGATASGKSGLAVALAQRWQDRGQRCLIVNADSAQVYADLSVLSARPDADDMGGVDHALFGYIDGAEACSAARWATDAKATIEAAHAERVLPLLVGGTGLYLRTLLDGIAPIPEIDAGVRDAVRALPVDQAYAALAAEDPASAARLAPSDRTRIARALEVIRSTGTSILRWRAERTGGIGERIALHPLVLLPPRDWLYARCDQRFAAMLGGGAVDEVRALLARKLDPALPVMRAIGVPEIAGLLAGTMDKDAVLTEGQQATRRYAKRQYTWFRHQAPMDWKRSIESIDVENMDKIERLFLD